MARARRAAKRRQQRAQRELAKLAPFRRYTDDPDRPVCQCNQWDQPDNCPVHGPGAEIRRLRAVVRSLGGEP